jgi:hypothetical protein
LNIIDDFMLEPEALVDHAARKHAFCQDDPRNSLLISTTMR